MSESNGEEREENDNTYSTDNNNDHHNDNGNGGGPSCTSSKLSFSLGGKKKKKTTTNSSSGNTKTVTAADFGAVSSSHERTNYQDNDSGRSSQEQKPLVIPLSQPTQSLLTRIKQEEGGATTGREKRQLQQESADDSTTVKQQNTTESSTGNEPEPPHIASTTPTNNNDNNNSVSRNSPNNQAAPLLMPPKQPDPGVDSSSSRDQLQRDLEQLPDEADEEQYEQVPVSQFGAALLRGMGWKEDQEAGSSVTKKPGEVMPRPHRLGLGAIPKAATSMGSSSDAMAMPSVLSGRRGKKPPKLSIAQLQQQEEFEKKRELQKKQPERQN